MAKHLNPLEKEFLIRRYRSNQRISIKDFCESNGITDTSLKKWMKQYDEGGLEGLARADAEIKEVLPEGVDRTEESYKREILKLRIENERLKKNYAVQTNALYKYNIDAVMNDRLSVNLGSVYESVVASELKAHGFGQLFYYDNKAHGEVEFILDDYDNAAILPIEVKSGKDYTIHHALNTFLSNPNYRVKQAFVLSNAQEIRQEGYVTYLPIYFTMFIKENPPKELIL